MNELSPNLQILLFSLISAVVGAAVAWWLRGRAPRWSPPDLPSEPPPPKPSPPRHPLPSDLPPLMTDLDVALQEKELELSEVRRLLELAKHETMAKIAALECEKQILEFKLEAERAHRRASDNTREMLERQQGEAVDRARAELEEVLTLSPLSSTSVRAFYTRKRDSLEEALRAARARLAEVEVRVEAAAGSSDEPPAPGSDQEIEVEKRRLMLTFEHRASKSVVDKTEHLLRQATALLEKIDA